MRGLTRLWNKSKFRSVLAAINGEWTIAVQIELIPDWLNWARLTRQCLLNWVCLEWLLWLKRITSCYHLVQVLFAPSLLFIQHIHIESDSPISFSCDDTLPALSMCLTICSSEILVRFLSEHDLLLNNVNGKGKIVFFYTPTCTLKTSFV